MIKAKYQEGNIVNHYYDGDEHEQVTVVGQVYDRVHIQLPTGGGTDVDIKTIEPIPLTPEWLGKFGFVTMDNEYDYIDWGREDTYLKFSFIQSGLPVDQQPFIFEYDQGMGDQKIELKFVHQLQNLYFALTGEELTIK